MSFCVLLTNAKQTLKLPVFRERTSFADSETNVPHALPPFDHFPRLKLLESQA